MFEGVTNLDNSDKISYKDLSNEIKNQIDEFRKNEAFYSFIAFNKFWTGRRVLSDEKNQICERLFGGRTFRHIPFETATITRIKQAFPQFKFYDQYSVHCNGKYYRIDTYIKELNVAIEVDGNHHNQHIEEDEIRQKKY